MHLQFALFGKIRNPKGFLQEADNQLLGSNPANFLSMEKFYFNLHLHQAKH